MFHSHRSHIQINMSHSTFLWFFRCFCLAPKVPNKSLISVVLSIYSFLSMFSVVSVFVYVFTLSNVLSDDSLVVVVCALLTLNQIITHLLVVGTAFHGRDQLNEIVNQLDSIDKTIRDLHTHLHHKASIKPPNIWKYLLVVVLITLCYTYCLLLDVSLNIMIGVHQVCILRARSIQIGFYVDLIGERLSMVNAELQTLSRLYNDSPWDATTQGICYQRMSDLKTIYGSLWTVLIMFKKCFGWSLLILTFQSIADLIINAFLIFAAFFSFDVPRLFWKHSFVSTMPTLITFVILCYSCHSCSAKVMFSNNIRVALT